MTAVDVVSELGPIETDNVLSSLAARIDAGGVVTRADFDAAVSDAKARREI